MQCLLGKPAGVRYEFGILFSFHSFECPFLFSTLISSVASIFPMKATTISAGPAKVRGLGHFLSLGPYWSCPFDDVLWSCCCLAPSGVVWVVGLCKDRILLVDPYLAKVQQGVCTDFADWCLFDCFVASSAVASLTFFVRPFACGLLRTLRISLPPHTILTDFLVALCRGGMPIGLGGDLR